MERHIVKIKTDDGTVIGWSDNIAAVRDAEDESKIVGFTDAPGGMYVWCYEDGVIETYSDLTFAEEIPDLVALLMTAAQLEK